ncbi:hypothetical protein [Homoserinibacter gongjuensis]|nr:hypothetical protein [Homoserinibacter gongjuensis]
MRQLAGDPREVEPRLQLKSQVEPFGDRSAQLIGRSRRGIAADAEGDAGT